MKTLAPSCTGEDVTSQPGGPGPELAPCPPPFSHGRHQISLPRLRELDIPWQSMPSTSMVWRSRPVGSSGGFSGSTPPFSASRRSVSLASYSYRNHPPLSTPALQYHHGPQDPALAVRGCPTDGFPAGLPSGAAASRQTHSNVKYTEEQIDFIAYFRCDLGLPWKAVEAKYAAVFPSDAKLGHRRRTPGLQGVYYRQDTQLSTRDNCGFFQFGGSDNPRLSARGRKATPSNGLLATHPERAIKYAWVSPEHKRLCESLCRSKRHAYEPADHGKGFGQRHSHSRR
ncbi:hypothetical protein K456DRAFT_1421201 [Colletotrichum gloeosporioides 23]|nr:hypothetical protein K456DRAFT_1421201 [Colletotrichum gloeosporioides 23]